MLVEIEGQLIFQVLPEPLDRVELWAVWGKKHELDVAWDRELLCLVKPAVSLNKSKPGRPVASGGPGAARSFPS